MRSSESFSAGLAMLKILFSALFAVLNEFAASITEAWLPAIATLLAALVAAFHTSTLRITTACLPPLRTLFDALLTALRTICPSHQPPARSSTNSPLLNPSIPNRDHSSTPCTPTMHPSPLPTHHRQTLNFSLPRNAYFPATRTHSELDFELETPASHTSFIASDRPVFPRLGSYTNLKSLFETDGGRSVSRAGAVSKASSRWEDEDVGRFAMGYAVNVVGGDVWCEDMEKAESGVSEEQSVFRLGLVGDNAGALKDGGIVKTIEVVIT
ncbi:hypothetical protein BDV95DRAFT_589389 [Massariosphaeria phaeospora]|uniref:Uncharacterized protein n=1 Tax=Massariosphaeria phaeospora TaxID=100035 RepID=A0A7C8MEA5_9PLEO|nr:hypothetical protein BDV95DRAFT_589389 [Massariosphaeria phaeospora]